MRFLLSHANLDEKVEDNLAFYLEFPRQVVNSNLLLHSPFVSSVLYPSNYDFISTLTV
jgi:hypothetical protein